jgi:3-hydroxyisobutyrate dehydrogenase
VKIGLIGTGLMGLPMAQRLIAMGVSLVVYNRTAAKLEPLRTIGAEVAGSAQELLQRCQGIILMLTNAAAIRQVLLHETTRIYLADRTILQMGTISPTDSRQLKAEIETWGGNYLEAPVLGSIPEAQTGNLLVMVGSSEQQFQQWQPLLQHLGPEPLRIGEVGTAAALKLALNQLIGALTTAFALSLKFVQQQNVEVEVFMKILRQSALYAPTFDKKLQRILEENYANPNFPTQHLLKDTNLFLEEARLSQLRGDSLEGVQRILERACQLGFAEADYSALFSTITEKFDGQSDGH